MTKQERIEKAKQEVIDAMCAYVRLYVSFIGRVDFTSVTAQAGCDVNAALDNLIREAQS